MKTSHLTNWFIWFATFNMYFQAERILAAYGPEVALHNIHKVWEKDITGRNVVVAVLDDGLNYYHNDLKSNYENLTSYDFVGNDRWPMPSARMTHGTQCAGVIAARRGGDCRTGIAYNAKVAGIRLFDGKSVNETRIAAAFGYKKNQIDIYSSSWGPADNGYFIKTLNNLEFNALREGANQGRNGLGSIFVFSSGNGGGFGDSCAFDGYVNDIHTIAIGAFTKNGVPRYAESCSSVMAVSYGDYVKTCAQGYRGCVYDFGRTSGATAIASGIIALLLEATNNTLTWRDVQHLIVRTSDPRGVNTNGREWSSNGAGLMVHPALGFGVLNTRKLIDVAQNNWKTVPEQIACSIKAVQSQQSIWRGGSNFAFSLTKVVDCSKIKTLEHVQAKVSLNFSPRAVMEMYLISPQGTTSQLLYKRLYDTLSSTNDYEQLVITSLHFWGENPAGEWRVMFKAAESMRFVGGTSGTVGKLVVTFYGTEKDPLSNNMLAKSIERCGGRRLWKGYGSACCGSWLYDPNLESCCRRTSEIVKNNPPCGSTTYNMCNEICCDGVRHNKLRNNVPMFCCGRDSYDKDKKICCSNNLHEKYECKEVRRSRVFGYLKEKKCSNGERTRSVWLNKKCPIPKKNSQEKGVTMDVYKHIPGGVIASLTGNPKYPNKPDTSSRLETLEAPRNAFDHYGVRLTTYYVPSESGAFTFYVAGDDQCRLSLSTDHKPENLRPIVLFPRGKWTRYRQWDKKEWQKSQPVQLIKGKAYYLEALMKEGWGGDHLSVGVRLPSGAMQRPISRDVYIRPPGESKCEDKVLNCYYAYDCNLMNRSNRKRNCAKTCGLC